MCMLSGFPGLDRRMCSMGRSLILDGLGYNGVLRLDRLGKNCQIFTCEPGQSSMLKLDELEQAWSKQWRISCCMMDQNGRSITEKVRRNRGLSAAHL